MEFLKAKARRVVIKIGTNSVIHADGQLLEERMVGMARQILLLQEAGLEVCMVSSGAIGAGVRTLGLPTRPGDLASLQACAAIGQPLLMAAWNRAFASVGLKTAQVLLTREDVRGRRRHLAARNTLEKILAYGAVPVVNENDTISADEIKFGDNDVLSSLVASLIHADLLIILSTIPGLMRDQGKGELIPLVESITPEIIAMAGGALNAHSTGGMISKLEAAKLATQSGCGTFIGSAAEPAILEQILAGQATGTFFLPASLCLDARKRWIAFFEKPAGQLALDAGAVHALRVQKTSLLAKGVRACTGQFAVGAVVTLLDPDGQPVARGLSAFSSEELKQVMGRSSSEIQAAYPDRTRLEVVHRDSLVLID